MKYTMQLPTSRITAALIAALSFSAISFSAHAEGDLVIGKQGSMEAGGKTVVCETIDSANNGERHSNGKTVVDNVYSTYQYPATQRYAYPILFNSGGGHTARFYDTTPDGREGWLTLFLREGFAVYGVDRVNTGRSGTDICQINAVKLGKAPASALPAINRYSAEAAWVAFRWGPKFGEAYKNTQFPIEAVDNYYPQTVSTYRDPDEIRKSVEAYSALIDKIGTPIVLETWSSSGPLGFLTGAERADKIKGIISLEPSVKGFEKITQEGMRKLATIPIIIVIGDNAQGSIDIPRLRKFQQDLNAMGGDVTIDLLPEAGIYGNGHTMALEKNNKQIMFRLIAWMEGHIYNKTVVAKKSP